MKFAVAPVHTSSLPYQFSIVEGGEFPANSRYGSIERSKFCLLGAVGEEENGKKIMGSRAMENRSKTMEDMNRITSSRSREMSSRSRVMEMKILEMKSHQKMKGKEEETSSKEEEEQSSKEEEEKKVVDRSNSKRVTGKRRMRGSKEKEKRCTKKEEKKINNMEVNTIDIVNQHKMGQRTAMIRRILIVMM